MKNKLEINKNIMNNKEDWNYNNKNKIKDKFKCNNKTKKIIWFFNNNK
jgi:hypothetical protein